MLRWSKNIKTLMVTTPKTTPMITSFKKVMMPSNDPELPSSWSDVKVRTILRKTSFNTSIGLEVEAEVADAEVTAFGMRVSDLPLRRDSSSDAAFRLYALGLRASDLRRRRISSSNEGLFWLYSFSSAELGASGFDDLLEVTFISADGKGNCQKRGAMPRRRGWMRRGAGVRAVVVVLCPCLRAWVVNASCVGEVTLCPTIYAFLFACAFALVCMHKPC